MDDMDSMGALADLCKKLKITGGFDEYVRQTKDPKYLGMAFTDRLRLILEAELSIRNQNRINRLLKISGLKDDIASIDNVLFTKERKLPEAKIRELARAQWVSSESHPWLLITGQTGCGKSWLTKALVRGAIQKGHKCLFIKTLLLMEKIANSVRENRFNQFADQLDSFELLALDDFNLLKTDDDVRYRMLEIIDRRWDRSALIINSQYPANQLYQYIGGKGDIKDAMMDRIINGSYLIEMNGRSMREGKEAGLRGNRRHGSKSCFAYGSAQFAPVKLSKAKASQNWSRKPF